MRVENLFFSAIHFLVISLIFGLGLLFFVLPHADHFRVALINVLLSPAGSLYWVGGLLLGVGILLFFLLYRMNRRGYLQLELGGGVIEVEEGVVQALISTYFRRLVPQEMVACSVAIRGGKTVELSISPPMGKGTSFFEQVERELPPLLARHLGYQSSLSLTVVESL